MSWNSAGRKKDSVWDRFTPILEQENGREITKQKCNDCNKIVSSRIERLKTHLNKCVIERFVHTNLVFFIVLF